MRKWTPKFGEKYYFICEGTFEYEFYIEDNYNTFTSQDTINIVLNNIFKTKIEAQVKLDKIIKLNEAQNKRIDDGINYK